MPRRSFFALAQAQSVSHAAGGHSPASRRAADQSRQIASYFKVYSGFTAWRA